jgi:hypothetical protein
VKRRVETIAVVAAMGLGAAAPAIARPQASAPACPVTAPNGVVAGPPERERGSYGNSLLSLGPFGLWPNGTVVFRPGGGGFVTRGGALGMKFGWTQSVPGMLAISGRRVDRRARPLRAGVSSDGTIGFHASYLIFSTPGCWQVIAQIGGRRESRLAFAFVTNVVKVGEEPAWRR